MRVVTASLPCWPNSGQSSVTGASMSSLPRLASTCAQSAVAPLVQEKTMPTVSRAHGLPVLGSAIPPHRSTTVSPPTVRQTEAPTSPCSAKFFWKASATRSKPFLHVPSTVMSASFLRQRQLEDIQQEGGRLRKAGLVDAVPDAAGDVHANRQAVPAQRFRRALGQHMRQHLVAVAVQQQ